MPSRTRLSYFCHNTARQEKREIRVNTKTSVYHRLNSPEIMPPARFLARPEPYMAFEAKPVAWLNLSHREKARVFVMVRTSAITETKTLAHVSSLITSTENVSTYQPASNK